MKMCHLEDNTNVLLSSFASFKLSRLCFSKSIGHTRESTALKNPLTTSCGGENYRSKQSSHLVSAAPRMNTASISVMDYTFRLMRSSVCRIVTFKLSGCLSALQLLLRTRIFLPAYKMFLCMSPQIILWCFKSLNYMVVVQVCLVCGSLL